MHANCPMWLSGVLFLICHYQMVSASKTIMTNEISMPSLGHKEETATFRRLQSNDNAISARYRSARFERLRAAPEDIKPVFVKPATIETEEPMFASSPPSPIQVVASSQTVTEVPMETVPTSNETPIEALPSFIDFPIETSSMLIPTIEATSPTFQPPSTAIEFSQEPSRETLNFAQERVYPTAVSVTPTIEFIEVLPSTQTEVASTNVVETEETETVVTSTKAPKKRRHRRKHRKLRKITKHTEAPTEVTTELPIEATEITTPSATTTTTSTTTSAPTTATTVQTIPTSGSTGAKVGESYLGGWNEDEGIIVTTSGPSLGSAINQFSEIPASISINDDKAIKEYYEKYYAEWYQKHNEASGTPGDATSAPREIKIELKPKTSPLESSTPQSFGISSSTAQPTKEQLDKVCDYVAKISKSFGIKDLVGFAKNNCSFVKSFHPTATCEQIQHLMQYCVTGVYVNNQ